MSKFTRLIIALLILIIHFVGLLREEVSFYDFGITILLVLILVEIAELERVRVVIKGNEGGKE